MKCPVCNLLPFHLIILTFMVSQIFLMSDVTNRTTLTFWPSDTAVLHCNPRPCNCFTMSEWYHPDIFSMNGEINDVMKTIIKGNVYYTYSLTFTSVTNEETVKIVKIIREKFIVWCFRPLIEQNTYSVTAISYIILIASTAGKCSLKTTTRKRNASSIR